MARILIIDDDDMMRDLLRDMLEALGHKIFEADTSELGIETYHQDTVDLVVTDLFIPRRGGLEVIKQLIASNPDVKIIAISGMDISGPGFRHDKDPKAIALQYGALRTFKKPFASDEFLGAVAELLSE
ncbi:MAG: response regulator [bacterium]|nr:response regulator [bacterium]